MSNTIHVDIVSAEREIFSGEVQMVFAPADMGEVGITRGHSPLVTQLRPGEVRVKNNDGVESAFYVSGGLLEVQPQVVTILSDVAQRAEDLNEEIILAAREAARRAFSDDNVGAIDHAKAMAQLAETAAQLQTIQRLRKRSGR